MFVRSSLLYGRTDRRIDRKSNRHGYIDSAVDDFIRTDRQTHRQTEKYDYMDSAIDADYEYISATSPSACYIHFLLA